MTKLRESAKGMNCFVRIPGVCNSDSATTVLAHLNGGPMGGKTSDLFGAFSCSNCHDVLDGRAPTDMPHEVIQLLHWQAIGRTQLWWVENGYIMIK